MMTDDTAKKTLKQNLFEPFIHKVTLTNDNLWISFKP